MAFRFPFRLVLLWLCFLVRGSYYAVEMPLWEGFDEYAHFARFSQATLPRSAETVTREVEASFHLAPVPDQLTWMGSWARTHPQWWALPAEERLNLRVRLRSLPRGWSQERAQHQYDSYEAQQAPLYYWVIAPVVWLASDWGLLTRVLLVRLLSVGIASASIPLAYHAGRKLISPLAGLSAAALLAVSPMFALDTARVANDCLAITLTSLVICLLADEHTRSWQIGLALGAALLVKAYLLTLIPAIVIGRYRRWHRHRRELLMVFSIALATGGWWYVRNFFIGGRASGWEDDAPLLAISHNLRNVDWPRAISTVLKSAIWFGGWSFLTVKPWIYNLLLLLFAICVLNGLRRWRQQVIPLAIIGCFLAGMVYDIGAQFTGHNTSSAPGWYLWAVSSAAAILIGAGAGRFIYYVLFALTAFDIYTSTFVLLPYHSGFSQHGRSFAHAGQFVSALERLEVPFALWMASVFCTLTIPAILLHTFRASTNVTTRQTGLT